MKPKLLVIELWGVGDLAIASAFLQKAAEQFEVTLLAKPFAQDLQVRFWPSIQVIPFQAPWTAFTGKYRLHAWPWRSLFRLWKQLRGGRFEVAVSARWDPRDHLLLGFSGAKQRLGYPRLGSGAFLTRPLRLPDPSQHRYEYWRTIGGALGLELAPADRAQMPAPQLGPVVLVHTGAGQAVRVWPLERYHKLVRHLREQQHQVRVVCNPEQQDWWLKAGENGVATPRSITELMAVMADARVFIGNDSGPGHLAALMGIPTFTLFGPQVPAWFAPLHPASAYITGKACPYKPCSDYCRLPAPECLLKITETEVLAKVDQFLRSPLRSVQSTATANVFPAGLLH